MRFAFSLSLAAIGVSFLLPSDGYKAALLISSSVLLFFTNRDPKPALAKDSEASEPSSEYDEDRSYDAN
ncbi:hypothetical protein NKY70_31650 [Sinorhizobium meliloti]|uniref:hypothetical protein n=1 Tax=Rhizobium meliloti TaxID=382 RepID=UPI000FE02B40|nr:hypothetical protein CN220_33910 [Sinorhizobium meliloti]